MNCNKCDNEATQASRDIRETEPTEDESGQLWRNWDAASDWHYGCDLHPPARTEYIPLDENDWWFWYQINNFRHFVARELAK